MIPKYIFASDVNNDLAKIYIIKQGVWSFSTPHLWVEPLHCPLLCMTPDASADMPTEHFYEWVHPLGSEPSRLVLVSRRTPSCSVQALPRWACVNGPSPRLNITPLQKRKSETVGKESSSNQKRFENLADTTLFLLSPFVGYSLSHIVLNHFVAPGGAGGARSGRCIVRMQTGRHGHCMRLGLYGGTDGWEGRARLKPREWPCRARFSPPTVSHHTPRALVPSLWVAWMWCTTKAMERTTSRQRRTRRRTTTTITSNNRWDVRHALFVEVKGAVFVLFCLVLGSLVLKLCNWESMTKRNSIFFYYITKTREVLRFSSTFFFCIDCCWGNFLKPFSALTQTPLSFQFR